MSEWPEIPVVKVLGTILAKKDNGEKEEAKAEAQGAAKGVLMPILTEKILEALSTMPEIDSPCTCKAAVICSEATAESVPVHIKVDGGTIHLSGLYELNKTNIQLEESFTGCKKDESGICKIAENYKEWILDSEWKEVDGASSQGEGKETLSMGNSYLLCTKYGGVIYFHNDGQEVREFISNKIPPGFGTIGSKGTSLLIEYENLGKEYMVYENEELVAILSRDVEGRGNITYGFGILFYNNPESIERLKSLYGLEFAEKVSVPIELCYRMYEDYINQNIGALQEFTRTHNIWLNQNQLDALVMHRHLTYRLGEQTKSVIIEMFKDEDVNDNNMRELYEEKLEEAMITDLKNSNSQENYKIFGEGWENRIKDELELFFSGDSERNY